MRLPRVKIVDPLPSTYQGPNRTCPQLGHVIRSVGGASNSSEVSERNRRINSEHTPSGDVVELRNDRRKNSGS